MKKTTPSKIYVFCLIKEPLKKKLKDPKVLDTIHAMIGGKFAPLTIMNNEDADMDLTITTSASVRLQCNLVGDVTLTMPLMNEQ